MILKENTCAGLGTCKSKNHSRNPDESVGMDDKRKDLMKKSKHEMKKEKMDKLNSKK